MESDGIIHFMVCLSVCLCIYLSACLLVCPSVWLSAHLSTYQSVTHKIFSSLYECYLWVRLCFPPFCKNTFLVITFELMHIPWWFWCLGLRSEGQGIRWQHSLFMAGLSICLSSCLPVCSSVSQSVQSLSAFPSYGQSSCLPGLHRGQFTYSHWWL